MTFDRFLSILIGAVLAGFAALLLSAILHDIWVMWAR
jgi:hypothetical protein